MGPFSNVTLSASYGAGVRSIDPIYITQDTGTPFASIKSWEGGSSYAGGTENVSAVVRSIFFQTHVDKDLLFSETVGRNTACPMGRRAPDLGGLHARVTAGPFDEAASVTLVKSTFDDTHLLVPYVPDVVVRSDTSVHGELGDVFGSPVQGGLGAGPHIGRRALPYGQRSDTIFTLDGSGTVAWRAYEMGLMGTESTRYAVPPR